MTSRSNIVGRGSSKAGNFCCIIRNNYIFIYKEMVEPRFIVWSRNSDLHSELERFVFLLEHFFFI